VLLKYPIQNNIGTKTSGYGQSFPQSDVMTYQRKNGNQQRRKTPIYMMMIIMIMCIMLNVDYDVKREELQL
jgi:hypothetical protein